MEALDHITAGRTVIRALLVAAVLTAGIAGTVGPVAAEPMDGKGDDPYPPSLYASLDGKGNDPYPAALYSLDGKGNDPFPPSLYELRVAAGVIDELGNDGVTYAFPIDNVTASIGRGGGSGKPSF